MKLLHIFTLLCIYTSHSHTMNTLFAQHKEALIKDVVQKNKTLFPMVPNGIIIANPTGTPPYSSQLYFRHQQADNEWKEEVFESSHGSYIFSSFGTKGTHFAALSVTFPFVSHNEFINDSLNTVKVWNIHTRQLVFTCHTRRLHCFLSPQETYIACDDPNNQSFKVHSLITAEIHAVFEKLKYPMGVGYCHTTPLSVAFSPNDRFVAYEENGLIEVRDLQNNPRQPLIIVQGYYPQFDQNTLKIKRYDGILDSILLSSNQKQQDPGSN